MTKRYKNNLKVQKYKITKKYKIVQKGTKVQKRKELCLKREGNMCLFLGKIEGRCATPQKTKD